MKTQNFQLNTYVSMQYFIKIFLLFTFLILPFTAVSQQLAFPTAKGSGAYNTGGRGGQVIHVTNLNSTGAGSFHQALNTPGPRIIVFDVGGTIDMTDVILGQQSLVHGEQYSNVTIAGQTAPGGITIEGSGFFIYDVNNIIIRHVRFKGYNMVSSYKDALEFYGCENIVLDHVSAIYGNDECITIREEDGTEGVKNVTVQNTLMGESKTGMIVGGKGTNNISIINNLWSNVSHRFPNPKEPFNGQLDVVNNVIYNWQHRQMVINFNGENDPAGNIDINYVGNVSKIGSWVDSDPGIGFSYFRENCNQIRRPYVSPSEARIYTGFNRMHRLTSTDIPYDNDIELWWNFNTAPDSTNEQIDPSFPGQNYFVSNQFPLLGQSFTIKTADNTWNDVLADVGANAYLDDNHNKVNYTEASDAKMINEAINDTAGDSPGYDAPSQFHGSHTGFTRPVNFDTDLDGMPDTWETAEFGNLNKDGTVDTDGDGYTDLENYLNLIDGDVVTIDVTGVTVSPETATINIPDTITLSASFEPFNASNQSGTWTSSNTAIATVNTNGLVSSVSEGVATITFNSNSGGFSDSATITVTNIPIGVESVSLSPETLELNINVTGELTATILPSNATNQTGVWSSSSTNIATVNQEGIVQPIAIGETVITFTSNDGGFSATSNVTVTDNNYGTYEFYNADSDNLIQIVDGGEVFDLDIIGDNINFRSIPAGGDGNTGVESVGVEWAGAEDGTYAESAPLYAGLNQHTGNDYWPYTVQEGTYVFTVKYYSENQLNGDIVATDVFTLTFVRGNYVSAGDDASICLGDTHLLTASGAESYLWSTGETTESIAVTPNTTTTYTVTGTHNDGSTTEDSVIVTVNEIPTVDVGVDQTICQGESITLTATASSGSFVWSNGATTQSITVSPSETTTYSVTVNSNGCISSDEVTINVIEAPTASVSDDITIPIGESVTLSASGGVSYEWSTGETSDSITVTPTTTTTYNVIVTNGNNCIDTASVTVTVIGPVVANAGDDVSICEGDSVVLSASGGDTYLWNNGETTQSITVSPENTSNYSVTVSDAFTSDTDSVLVTVNPVPVVDAGDDVTINQGESVTLYGSGGNNYLWSTGDTNANISVSPTETTTYNVTTTINGCSDTDSVTVTVITLVQALAGDDQSICLGGEAILTAEGGDTYLWSTGETTQSITVNPDSNTDYTVTVTNQYGSDSDDVTVIISECPAMDFEFRAYPNPTTGVINVKLSGLNTISIIQVTDILGKQLKYIEVQPNSGQTTNLIVDITGMTKGFYMMTFYGDNRTITKKMVLR